MVSRQCFCDGKLINFLSYYFKIEIIYIGTLVSMNDLFSFLMLWIQKNPVNMRINGIMINFVSFFNFN